MTRTARFRTALALGAVAALALAGCAGVDEPGTPPPPSAAESMTPEPEPTASATVPAPAPAAGVNSIATPADGSTVAGPDVDVTGAGTAFEGTLLWRVLAAGTDGIVADDFTTAGANGVVGPYAFSVELTPGSYTLEVWEPDVSDDEATGTDRHELVTSTFTVT